MTKQNSTDPRERRRHKRHPIQADVLVVPKDTQFEHFWAVTENISTGGMFVRTSKNLPAYTEVQVKLFPERGFVVNAVATIVHSSPAGFGCCFAYVPHQSKNYLDRWLGRSGGLTEVSGTIQQGDEGNSFSGTKPGVEDRPKSLESPKSPKSPESPENISSGIADPKDNPPSVL